MLLDLAEMEERHLKIMSQLRHGPAGGKLLLGASTGDVAWYLRAIADGYVFDLESDPSGELGAASDARGVLRKAIDLEKDSIVFYLGLSEAISDDACKAVVEAILKEEMRHITDLSEKLASLG